ncbi:hypothetical protein BEL04_15955 [Mucilaginibacter sp. PPCGB 2223]|uniref:DUF4468 domain-containing protein n=1 Tax=Mucilaginibacter sp. PPCGB 2223 TaxID=1886027 RepID=UPI000826D6F7|nr:DUF4468 domain-containing protein [Mucilaginibacter sp. PPCGB 2223]OCX51518.1 hypothetical protein BEL04_15955 [Mucilaginibacter sp. PPCGB 2223]
MKRVILALTLCLGFARMAVAQKDSLATDEHGKYIYYHVNAGGHSGANVLLVRALDFFDMPANSANFKITDKDANAKTVDVTGFFAVQSTTSLTKHDDGKITFKLRIEVKDGRYRYWLSNFVFIPYYKDRYNNLVPKPGVEIPAEELNKKIDGKDAAHYLDECAAFGIKFGARFKKQLESEPVKTTNGKKVIVTDKW